MLNSPGSIQPPVPASGPPPAPVGPVYPMPPPQFPISRPPSPKPPKPAKSNIGRKYAHAQSAMLQSNEVAASKLLSVCFYEQLN